MANYITTEITGPPAIIEHLIRARTEEEVNEAYSFCNRFTAWHINQGYGHLAEPKTAWQLTREVDFNLLIPEPKNIGRDWYSWRTKHWGTKWNGMEHNLRDTGNGKVTIRFDTAWNHPIPVIETLSRAAGDTALTVRYASEDLGYNLGDYTAHNGTATENQELTEGSDEAREFAAQLIHHTTYAKWQQD